MPDLSDNVNWSEVDANNNQAPPNGWPEGMMPSGVNDAARADRGAMKRFWDKINSVQVITPSGGVYTFTTANPAYPTAYVTGEIYCFKVGVHSVGGELFQVNALPPKPILKRIVSGTAPGWNAPIIAYDIVGHLAVQLVYDDTFDAFILLNPFVPIHGDGTLAGGVSTGGLSINGTNPGKLIINRNPAPPPPVLGSAITSVPLQIIGNDGEGPICALNSFGATPFALRFIRANGTGVTPSHTNSGEGLGNLAWEGYGATSWTPASARIVAVALETFTDFSQGTCLQFTSTPVGQNATVTQAVIGPGLTVGAPAGPSGGMQVGDINAQRIFVQGQVVADGSGSSNVGGNLTVGGTVTANGVQSNGDMGVTGHFGVVGNADITGNISSGGTVGGQSLYSAGDATIAGNAGVNGHLGVLGNADITGNISSGGSVGGQSLYSAGDGTISHNLNVTGASNLTGLITCANGLDISGIVPSSGGNSLYVNGSGYFGGNITVTGLTTTHGILPDSNNTSSSGLSGQAWAQVASYWFNNVSDQRLKTDIRQPDMGALAQVMLIKPAEFHWRDKESPDMPLHRGFLAADVREVMGERFAGYSKENDVEGLAYHELTAVLWQAVQELAEEVKELRQQIDR